MTNYPGYRTLNIKKETSYTIGIIAANEHKKIYEIVEEAVREKYPKYFEKQKVVKQ